MNKNTFYITTPIYYVNDKPHIGHAYTTIICDIIARFGRLAGQDVFFLTGTDEHGQKVQQSAEAKGVSPEDFVEPGSKAFKDLFKALNISFDDFIRTTEPRHKKAAQALWTQISEKGYLYKGTYSGWYSVRDEAYYVESDLINGVAPTGAPVVWLEEDSYFFKLSAFQERLLDFYEKNPEFIQPASRRNEVLSFVKSGLKDLSISRSNFHWGVPVPGDSTHVMYVWFDALTNYISALGYPDTSHLYKKFWPARLHMVGKDILRFHAVYWPAMLMAAGLPLPKKVFAHGFWTRDGQKMSKSLGNGLDPYELIDEFGVDQTRFFMAREVPLGQDGDFSRTSFIQLVNSHLANDLGNLSQRVLSMVHKNCGACVPNFGALEAADEGLLTQATNLYESVFSLVLETQEIQKYCEALWRVIREANKYIDSQAPWTLRKTNPARMETVLYVLVETLRYIGILVQPIMPEAADRLLGFLSVSETKRHFASLSVKEALVPGAALPKPEGLFPRIVDLNQEG